VPAEWLDQSLAERWSLACPFGRVVHEGYGFLWWILDLDGYTVWNASGWGGQEIWLLPELGLNFVITHDTTNAYQPGNQQIAPGKLIRAVLGDELPRKESARCPENEFQAVSIRPDGTQREVVEGWPVEAIPGGWSGGQGRIVAAWDRPDLNSEIYALTPQGAEPFRLTYDLDFDIMPAWSPDGDHVAYVHGPVGSSDLYTVSSGGLFEQKRITDLPGAEESPTWSPDGNTIAFVRPAGEQTGFGAPGNLWTIGAGGATGAHLLLGRDVAHPAWSPDEDRIAFELWEGDQSLIAVLNISDMTLTDFGPGFVPSWSPDGVQLAFTREVGGAYEIFVADSVTRDVTQLTFDGGFNTIPFWSPDGETIRFMSRAND
jgi:dipeptidyl aminopeptidase/acylaminoacyl peptidase